MAADEKWYFTKDQLANTPSRKCGYETDKELSYRQQAANFIQDMGQRLQVTQLCINTAIVYMHRFYVFHSFTQFHRNAMAAAALFLAAKVEEQPRKLEHVIKVAHMCLNRDQPPLDTKSEKYLEQAQDLVFNENVLLQTLGFDVAIDHPHTHVVRCCHLVRASKDLAQTSYFMASNSLHLTTMCLQYKPTVVACFCIHLACKWSNWEIPQSNEGKDWFWYVDKTVSLEQLELLTAEFLVIFDKCPTKLKRKIMSISATQNPTLPPAVSGSLFDMEPRKIRPPDGCQDGLTFHTGVLEGIGRPPPHHSSHMPGDASSKPPADSETLKKPHQTSSCLPGGSGPSQQSVQAPPRVDYRDYKEKKERERLAQQTGVSREGHHGGATHVSKSAPGSASKHGSVPPGSSGIIGKPGQPHWEHKHPPPIGPGLMRVTQARDAIRREQSYSREAVKRENSNQRIGEHIFAPPVRHHEPKEPLLPAQGEHVSSQHHGLPLDSALSVVNHLGSGLNSGINCSISSRKDNQGLEWTSEKASDLDSRHVIDKSNVPGGMKSTENRHLVPLHVDSSLKRSQQQGFESSSRHCHRGSATNGSDARTVKEDVPSKMPSDSSDSQRHLYNHNRHNTGSDRLDHGRHRKSGASEQFTSRPPQSSVEGIVERKQNISEMGEWKPNVVDRRPNAVDVVNCKPVVTDLVDRKSNVLDQSGSKQNTAELYSSVVENRHESSNRKPGVSDAKHQVVQPYQNTKRDSKPDINAVKKDNYIDFGSRVGASSARPPPTPLPPHPLPLPSPQQQPTQPALAQPPLLPNAATLPSHHHSQERHKSRPKSPSQVHEKPPSLHHQHSRSAVPPRAKSPISATISVPSNVCKRSESPHHARTKPTTVTVLNTSIPRSSITVTEVKSVAEAKSKWPEVHVAKPVVAADQTSETVKSEAEMLLQTSLKVFSGSQKGGTVASLPITPDKAGTTALRELSHPRSSKSRQRTPPSSGSKKIPAPLPEIPSTPLSPFGSPPTPTPTTPGSASKLQGSLKATKRHRTSSSSSEPELVPVVKKLDEIAGYENIIRDSKMGIRLPNRVPDIIPPIRDRSKKDETVVAASAIGSSHNSNNSVMSSVGKELKTPDLIRPFATQMSDALSQTARSAGFPDDLGAVAFPDSDSTNDSFVRSKIPPPPIASEEALSSANIQTVGIIDISTMEEHIQPLENVVPTACSSLSMPEHHHKSEKKKRKKEHKEHKHKDKDKNREEKKHKHKHRDKDKDRHKREKAEGSAPIKITIPKDKINLSSPLEPVAGTGLKLKLKNYMFKSTISTDSSPQPALGKNIKIKIGDEVISNFSNSNMGPPALSTEAPSSSRKRDYSSPRSSELVSPPGPPAKSSRLNTSSGDQRRSGNNCSNYGKQNGVEHHRRGSHYSFGNKVVQKLADTHNSYQSKGKSSTSSGSQP
ncbi:cyclin-T isoform X3 [Zootermopsis nevadensis]|nr:cyclin-T isoform X3 [Zootermopsis nevadensis]